MDENRRDEYETLEKMILTLLKKEFDVEELREAWITIFDRAADKFRSMQ